MTWEVKKNGMTWTISFNGVVIGDVDKWAPLCGAGFWPNNKNSGCYPLWLFKKIVEVMQEHDASFPEPKCPEETQ